MPHVGRFCGLLGAAPPSRAAIPRPPLSPLPPRRGPAPAPAANKRRPRAPFEAGGGRARAAATGPRGALLRLLRGRGAELRAAGMADEGAVTVCVRLRPLIAR